MRAVPRHARLPPHGSGRSCVQHQPTARPRSHLAWCCDGLGHCQLHRCLHRRRCLARGPAHSEQRGSRSHCCCCCSREPCTPALAAPACCLHCPATAGAAVDPLARQVGGQTRGCATANPPTPSRASDAPGRLQALPWHHQPPAGVHAAAAGQRAPAAAAQAASRVHVDPDECLPARAGRQLHRSATRARVLKITA